MLFFLSGWCLTLLKCWLTDGENHLWQGGREIITWLLSNSTHRQDKNIREDPACQAASKSCLHSFVQVKIPPPPPSPNYSLQFSFFLYLSLPIYLILSLFLFALQTHTLCTDTHPPTTQPPTACRMLQLSHPFIRRGKPAWPASLHLPICWSKSR